MCYFTTELKVYIQDRSERVEIEIYSCGDWNNAIVNYNEYKNYNLKLNLYKLEFGGNTVETIFPSYYTDQLLTYKIDDSKAKGEIILNDFIDERSE